MNVACIATIIFVALSASASGQTVGVADFKSQTKFGDDRILPGHVRVLVGGNAYRIEVEVDLKDASSGSIAGKPGALTQARTVMIAKFSEPTTAYMLNNQRRNYTVLDSRRHQPTRDGITYSVKRLGSDIVAGFSCEKALVISSEADEIEVCLTRGIGASGAWVDAMNGRSQDSGVFRALHANELDGFPIRWLIRSGREKFATSFELVRFDKMSVQASAFEIPVGYQKSDPMGAWASPEQEKAMLGIQQKALEQLTREQRKKYEEYLKQQHRDH